MVRSKIVGITNHIIEYIDSGEIFKTPFKFFYIILATFNLLIPVALIVFAVEGRVFSSGVEVIIAFLLLLILLCLASWMGFKLLMDRKEKIDHYSRAGDEFIAIPVIAHFVQTIGEYIGLYIFTVCSGALLIILISFGFLDVREPLAYSVRNFTAFGFIGTYLYAFFIFLVTRLFAETFHAITAIAYNTKALKDSE